MKTIRKSSPKSRERKVTPSKRRVFHYKKNSTKMNKKSRARIDREVGPLIKFDCPRENSRAIISGRRSAFPDIRRGRKISRFP